MKIAFISQGGLQPRKASGSTAIWTDEIIRKLNKEQNVTVYEMDGEMLHSVKINHEGTQYIYAPKLLNHYLNLCCQKLYRFFEKLSSLEGKSRRPFFSSAFHNFGYIAWVSLHLRKNPCDIIHVHQFSQYIPILRLLNPKSKIVLHMHCEWLTQLDTRVMRRRIGQADLIIGSSDYITEKTKKFFPEYSVKIKTVYNGVDHKVFINSCEGEIENRKNYPELLFVGRVSPEKGIHILIDAIQKLVVKYPHIHLNIVGPISPVPRKLLVDLDDEPTVKALARFYESSENGLCDYFKYLKLLTKKEIKDCITFCGKQPHTKIVGYYQFSDLLINPSLSESFGMSLVEAMSSGKPTISTSVGGMVNIVIDGETGLLVEPDNDEALADAICFLIERPELRRSMGAAGRKRIIEKFTWDRVSSKLLEEYQYLIVNGPAKSRKNSP